MKNTLLIGTRKGLVTYHYKKGVWSMGDVHFNGVPVSIAYGDERNGNWWACLDHGHWGVKLHRSNDQGKSWEEVEAPTYSEGMEIKDGVLASTKYLWAMQHGGTSNPNRIWIGTEPGGLFISEDSGYSFQLIESLWNHPTRKDHWFGGGRDHAGIHSIVLDPENADHLYVGISCAGVFETFDSGKTWEIRNNGLRADFLPDPFSEAGHDPHILIAAKSNKKIMWQQNHCGIFKSIDGGEHWLDVSEKDGPALFGFALAVSEDNADQAWVAPAVSDTHRVAIDHSLCICRTDDGGNSWKALRSGLPQGNSFDIVYRHCLVNSGDAVVFGTTTGNLFYSPNRGDEWSTISNYLPMVYSIQFINI